jgi:hypothetical protein
MCQSLELCMNFVAHHLELHILHHWNSRICLGDVQTENTKTGDVYLLFDDVFYITCSRHPYVTSVH